VTVGRASAPGLEARRALVLHDWPVVIDLITLTLNHGVFAVRAASSLAEEEAILAAWSPQLAMVDMDHADSTTLSGHRAFERGTVTDEKHPPWPPAVGWR
jgi:CheY-like chemotaxis protein